MSKKEEKKTDASSGSGAGQIIAAPPDDDDESEGGGGGAPGWMATFADLVTLLMCFFVLLFAMSSTQQESFKELVQSLKSALGVQQVPEAGTREGLLMPVPEAPEKASEERKTDAVDEVGAMVQKEVDEIVSNVRELIMFNQLGGMVKVEGDELGATITISDVVLFPPGEAVMNREGLNIMKKIATVLAQFNYHIKIAGHTDNTPIHTEKYPSNWELSANRACEVVRFLANTGIDPAQMSAEGYAEFKPIAQNTTPESRAQNRRVEIVYERRQIEETIFD
jgi:chemotaxis protein MotB